MKKILSISLIFAIVVCFAGCGNKSSHSDSELYIGGIGPLTGDYSNYGLSVSRGAQIAVDEINAAGGVNGMKFVLKYEDSGADSDVAKAAYGTLIDWGMNVSLGGVFSGETKTIATEAVQDDILVFTPSGSDDSCISMNDKAFRVCFYDTYQGKAAADYIADHNLAKKVAIFYQSDLNYSIGNYNAFKAECAVKGLSIVGVESFTADTNGNFDAQIEELIAADPEIIFMPIYAAEAAVFLNNAGNGTANAKFAADVKFFGVDGLDGIIGKVSDNPAKANNVIMLTPFAADNQDAAVQAFVKKYKAAHGSEPDQFAADGYDAIYAIKAAIENAGIKKASDATGTKLAAAMQKITLNGITGTATWGADGNTQKNALAVIYQNGVGSLLK